MSRHTVPSPTYSEPILREAPGEPGPLILHTPLSTVTPQGPAPTPTFSDKKKRYSLNAAKPIATIAARFIEDTFNCGGEVPPLPEALRMKYTEPADATLPSLQLDGFIAYVLYRTQLDKWKVYSALYILEDFRKKWPYPIGSDSHKLFVAALMVAAKVIDDEPYSSRSWAAATGDVFNLHELNSTVHTICVFLEHNLHMDFDKLSIFETAVRLVYGSLAEAQLEAAAINGSLVKRKPPPPYIPPLTVSHDFNMTPSSAADSVPDPRTRRPDIYAPAPTTSIASSVSLEQSYMLSASESFPYTLPSDTAPLRVRRKTPPVIYAQPVRSFTLPEWPSIAPSNQPLHAREQVTFPPTRSLTMTAMDETERRMWDELERSSAPLAQDFPASGRPLPARPAVSTSGQPCASASNAPHAHVVPGTW